MKTEIITDDLQRAAELIRAGGLVAVPTETVYGLAGNGLDAEAVRKIYEVKGRPEVKPLSLMIHDAAAMAECWETVPAAARILAERYWPGPLTIVAKARETVPEIVRAGGKTVGLRCPDHAKTRKTLELSGVPFAAPSANPSGEPSPKDAADVARYFQGKIEGIIDGGRCGIGTESTIIDLSEIPYRILRHGALPEEEVFQTLTDGVTIVGVTGGTGCGKTTALSVLERMGARIIDCDEVYHDLTIHSEAMKQEICEHFGNVYHDGMLDRKMLGNIVFNDTQALQDLNSITHRYVDREIFRILRECALNGRMLAAIDAIALLENCFAEKSIFNVAITAPLEARVERLMLRENISEEYARLRISAQKPNEYFAERCDYTLENNCDMAAFEEKCEKFFTEALKDVRR